MQYRGQPLTPYRYCVEEDVCNEVLNQLPPYSLIQYLAASDGRCHIKSVDLQKVGESKSGKLCYENNQDELHEDESKIILYLQYKKEIL